MYHFGVNRSSVDRRVRFPHPTTCGTRITPMVYKYFPSPLGVRVQNYKEQISSGHATGRFAGVKKQENRKRIQFFFRAFVFS